MTTSVRKELSRLGRAWARTEGRRAGRRVAILALLVFLVLCALHRLGPGLPLLATLEARPLVAVVVVALAFALAWLAERLVAIDRRPAPTTLARRLDDSLALSDATDAAVSARASTVASPVVGSTVSPAGPATFAELVEARTATRLAALDPQELWRGPPGRSRIPLVLALAALFLLLAPGVLGIGGDRGAGRGTDLGVGRRPKKDPPKSGWSLSPEDADKWLAEHARVVLEVGKGAWNEWTARLITDLPLPDPYSATIHADVDDSGPLGKAEVIDAIPGLRANTPVEFEGDRDPEAKKRLTPGRHAVRVVLRPTDGPWTRDLVSPPVDVIVPPPSPNSGGGGMNDENKPKPQPPPSPPPPSPPPPAPPPPPPPAPPPPAPPPDKGSGASPPEAKFHDEAVEPLSAKGETVKKDTAVVAVRDPNAGSIARRAVPIEDALKDFDHVVESAVASEKILPADRDLVRRYFEALRRLTTGAPPTPAAPAPPKSAMDGR